MKFRKSDDRRRKRASKGTILSRREYRQDSFCAVAVWTKGGPPFELNVLRDFLINPQFVLYLGRKACALSLPLNPRVLSADTIEEALTNIPFPPQPRSLFHRIMENAHPFYCWDDDAATELSRERTVSRRDAVLSADRLAVLSQAGASSVRTERGETMNSRTTGCLVSGRRPTLIMKDLVGLQVVLPMAITRIFGGSSTCLQENQVVRQTFFFDMR